MKKNNLGSFNYKPNHTFLPFKHYKNNSLWMVMSFKTNNVYSSDEKNVVLSHYSVVASSPEEAVKKAFKAYEINKVY